MRVIVVGLGIQGHKRREFAKTDYVASVDPIHKQADYKNVEAVPLTSFDAALLCVPDEIKVELISYFLHNHKHVLVEKPLWAATDQSLINLEQLAHSNGVICYSAYNHRFEPHFIRMRDLITSDRLGEIYHCRLFYGNGTARLVRESAWRDKGAGVLPDLGSHLLDTANFWFNTFEENFSIVSSRAFENRAPDHVSLISKQSKPQLEIGMTLLSWRNHFSCDVFAEKGSAHISSLCKWGTAVFTQRTRIFPCGHPIEESITLKQQLDPTWHLEYEYFKKLCQDGSKTDFTKDLWLNRVIQKLSIEAMKVSDE